MKICVIGTGYVGLVSGTCFAEFGFQVTCVDVNAQKIENLNKGIIPIYEPGLDDLVLKNVTSKNLSFSTNLGQSVQHADVIFIAVGTPTSADSGKADLSYVFKALEDLAPHVTTYKVVVVKSTVPVGTCRKVSDFLAQHCSTELFDVVSNPEFLREGAAIEDFMRPNRVVIGSQSERATALMKQLYRPLYLFETPAVYTSWESAEVIKYSANAFLATKISFINQISDLCEACGANIQDVAKGIGLDHRIGSKFLHPSPGYGGSCFPKDARALLETAKEYAVALSLIEAGVSYNDARKHKMAERVTAHFKGNLNGKVIGVLGLTFKPNTDDMRESPSLSIIPELVKAGAIVQAYDPKGMDEAHHFFRDSITYCQDAYQAITGSDVTLILTEWNAFRGLDLKRMKSLMKSPCVFDFRNIYTLKEMNDAGFEYHSLGRRSSDYAPSSKNQKTG